MFHKNLTVLRIIINYPIFTFTISQWHFFCGKKIFKSTVSGFVRILAFGYILPLFGNIFQSNFRTFSHRQKNVWWIFSENHKFREEGINVRIKHTNINGKTESTICHIGMILPEIIGYPEATITIERYVYIYLKIYIFRILPRWFINHSHEIYRVRHRVYMIEFETTVVEKVTKTHVKGLR